MRKKHQCGNYKPIGHGYRANYGPDCEGFVTVIKLSSDASLDYSMQETRAIELYRAGKLCWDVTNGSFSE